MKKLFVAAVSGMLLSTAYAAPVATVNGVAIDSSTLDNAVKQLIAASNGQAKDTPELRDEVKQRLINRQLIVDAASKAGLDKQADFIKQLENTRTELLQQAYFNQVASKVNVSDEALKTAYQQYAKQFAGMKEVNVRQIIVAKEDEAKKLIADLKKGAKFDVLARSKSIHQPSRERGGELGWGNLSAMEPVLAKALQAIPKGQISDQPLKSGLGWHIFKVEDIRDAQAAPFDKVKGQIARDLQEKAISDAIGDLRQRATIQ